MSQPGYCDSTMDAIALTEAVLGDPTGHVKVLSLNMNPYAVALTLAKLMSEALLDNAAGQSVCPGCFRHWAESAARRSS
jgi:hypothetical protein